jgi:hypothetical protein
MASHARISLAPAPSRTQNFEGLEMGVGEVGSERKARGSPRQAAARGCGARVHTNTATRRSSSTPRPACAQLIPTALPPALPTYSPEGLSLSRKSPGLRSPLFPQKQTCVTH